MLESAPYLRPTYFLDSDNPDVVEYAYKNTSPDATPEENAVRLYYAVRDDFTYNPYKIDLRPTGLKASDLLKRNYGYCVEKAVLLATTARVVGIPTRLSFFNVRNHIATEKVERMLQTDLLVFHGCTELWLSGRWIKATPAFNAALCTKLNVPTLEFDGKEDSIFQQFDHSGNVFMDYVHEYGAFHDLPYDLFLSELLKHYGAVINEKSLAKTGLMIDLNALAA